MKARKLAQEGSLPDSGEPGPQGGLVLTSRAISPVFAGPPGGPRRGPGFGLRSSLPTGLRGARTEEKLPR